MEKVKYHHKKRRVLKQVLWKIAVVFVAFFLMVACNYIYMTNLVEKYLVDATEKSLSHFGNSLTYDLNKNKEVVNTVAATIEYMLHEGESQENIDAYIKFVTERFFKHREISRGFMDIYAAFPIFDGAFLSGIGEIMPDDYDPTTRPWYTDAVRANGNVTQTHPYPDMNTKTVVLTFTRALFANDDIYDKESGKLVARKGDLIGVVCSDIELEMLESIQNEVYEYHTGGNYRFLTTSDLNVIAHHEKRIIGYSADEMSDIVRDIKDSLIKKGEASSVEGLNYEDKQSILFCKQLDNGWFIGVVTPTDQHFKDVRSVQIFLFLFGTLFALILSGLLIIMDRTTGKAIGESEKLLSMSASLEKQIQSQSLMMDIAQKVLWDEDTDKLVNSVCSKIGKYMRCSQIRIYTVSEDDGGDDVTITCKYEWLDKNAGIVSALGKDIAVPRNSPAATMLQNHRVDFVTSNDENVREAIDLLRKSCSHYLIATVFVNGKSFAIIDIACDYEKFWTTNDIGIAKFFAGILSSYFQRKNFEEQLKVAKEAAEFSNRSKGMFLASMSHEIRTPLNAILGMTEIQLQNELSPEVRGAFELINDSGSLLINIINDILDFSKIEAGKMEITPVNYNIPSIVGDLIQLIRFRYSSKPIEFKLSIDPGTPLSFHGDELRIKQVLNNLLSNAFKYTEKGTVELSVYCEDQNRRRKEREEFNDDDTIVLVFRVSDTGQGMRADQIERLYDEYSRFNMNINRTTVGTGLGMSITKRLVELMYGDIDVVSQPGKGTTFIVRLPQKSIGDTVCGKDVDKLLQSELPKKKKKNNISITREHMPYGKVLIVDDVMTNIVVAKGLMAPYALKIDTAMSGQETIEKIKDGNEYDIIFMDHMMPVMDGIEVTKILRGSGYTGTIIALTANALHGQEELFLSNGFDAFIPKPIDMRELDIALNTYIRDKQAPGTISSARRQKQDVFIGSADKSADVPYDTKVAFISDCEKSFIVLDKTLANISHLNEENMQEYIVSVHGIKNALDAVGEKAMASFALRLEQAGRERDMRTISGETPEFFSNLRAIVKRIRPKTAVSTINVSEADMEHFKAEMNVLAEACQDFDVGTAKAIVAKLKERLWSQDVTDDLAELSKGLLHSDFDAVKKITDKYSS